VHPPSGASKLRHGDQVLVGETQERKPPVPAQAVRAQRRVVLYAGEHHQEHHFDETRGSSG